MNGCSSETWRPDVVAGMSLARRGSMNSKKILPVTFDAVGAGNSALLGFNPSITATNTHTCSGTNRGVVIIAGGINNGLAATGQTRTATYDGVNMTSLGMGPDGASGNQLIEIFFLLNPPTGLKTWVVTVSGGGNTGRALSAFPVSYNNVGSASGTTYPNFGTGTAMSDVATSAVNEMVVNGFVSQGGHSAYTQTQRASFQVGGNNTWITGGDAPGAASVTFAGTTGSSSWAGIAARLLPA